MTVTLRPYPTGSWLDPRSTRRLSAALTERLTARLKGEVGVFLTLTYDRNRWSGPRELWDRSQRSKHVARFLERLSERLGESFTGRWFCKLEFQEGGWVHWHIILVGVRFVPKSILDDCWKFGHTWVTSFNNRASVRKVAQYASKSPAKYAAKGGEFPPWLYCSRTRAIKVVRVSPGFWNDPRPPRCERDPVPCASTTLPIWVPIGARIEECRNRTVVEVATDDGSRSYATVAVDINTLVAHLVESGAVCTGRAGSGVEFRSLPAWKVWAAVSRATARDRGPFHLNQSSNRASDLPGWMLDVVLDGAA